eukprot:scaffold1663_cov182-Skeletonema_marinoi.AAC.3
MVGSSFSSLRSLLSHDNDHRYKQQSSCANEDGPRLRRDHATLSYHSPLQNSEIHSIGICLQLSYSHHSYRVGCLEDMKRVGKLVSI